MKTKIMLLFFLLFLPSTDLFAATATVTNNGNFTIRVQYKTPDGTYEELGHLEPGQTMQVPGGVEKVKIVREIGEWAHPLRPGQVLEVEVKLDGKSHGTMTWFGDKVFFDPLTEGPRPVTAGARPVTEIPGGEKPLKPVIETPGLVPEPKPESGSTDSNWPWLGGYWDFFFPFMFVLLWLPLLFFWLRQRKRLRYSLGSEWVGKGGWGWGWSGGTPCGWRGIVLGLLVGIIFGGFGLWGYLDFYGTESYGFLGLLARDFYAIPFLLFGKTGGLFGMFPMAWTVLLFWVFLCSGLGFAGGIIPLSWLYSAPLLVSVLPFILLTRGCAGSKEFVLDGGYGGSLLYPSAFLAGSYFCTLVADSLLDLVDPYYLMDDDKADDIRDAVWDFFHGRPAPLLVFLGGGCVTCFYDCAYYSGWNNAVAQFIHGIPLMFFGSLTLPFNLLNVLFWLFLFGGLGWTFFRTPARGLFYLTLVPAFLVLLILTMGNYPQRNLNSFYGSSLNENLLSTQLRIQGTVLPELRRVVNQDERTDRFGDALNGGALGTSGALGRDLLFGDQPQHGDHQNQQIEYAE